MLRQAHPPAKDKVSEGRPFARVKLFEMTMAMIVWDNHGTIENPDSI